MAERRDPNDTGFQHEPSMPEGEVMEQATIFGGDGLRSVVEDAETRHAEGRTGEVTDTGNE